MDIDLVETGPVKRELRVKIFPQDVWPFVEQYVASLALKGFRPGKVPIKHAMNLLGDAIYGEACSLFIQKNQDAFATYFKREDIYGKIYPDIQGSYADLKENGPGITVIYLFETTPFLDVSLLPPLTLYKPIINKLTDEELQKYIDECALFLHNVDLALRVEQEIVTADSALVLKCHVVSEQGDTRDDRTIHCAVTYEDGDEYDKPVLKKCVPRGDFERAVVEQLKGRLEGAHVGDMLPVEVNGGAFEVTIEKAFSIAGSNPDEQHYVDQFLSCFREGESDEDGTVLERIRTFFQTRIENYAERYIKLQFLRAVNKVYIDTSPSIETIVRDIEDHRHTLEEALRRSMPFLTTRAHMKYLLHPEQKKLMTELSKCRMRAGLFITNLAKKESLWATAEQTQNQIFTITEGKKELIQNFARETQEDPTLFHRIQLPVAENNVIEFLKKDPSTTLIDQPLSAEELFQTLNDIEIELATPPVQEE